MSDQKIKVAITNGDPNGIGMETIIKVFSDTRMAENIVPIIYSHPEIIRVNKKALNIDDFHHTTINAANEAIPKKVNLINIARDLKINVEFGKASRDAGSFAFKSLECAVNDLAANKVDVLVTAPIDKDTIQSKDFSFPGHTEYLSKIAGTEDVLMFLVSPILKIGVVTGHVPLKDVSSQLTKEKIIGKLKLMRESLLRDFGISTPRIAVLGLNPHAGDNGLIGQEEKEIILPAIREVADKGHYVFGPYGADGFFGSGAYSRFDAVLAMYHDQGLAPFKTLAFESGVNYTAGLPIVRTSPDHGVGYDIAGKGTADESSLRAAIYMACDIYKKRKEYREFTSNPLQKQEVRDSKDDVKE